MIKFIDNIIKNAENTLAIAIATRAIHICKMTFEQNDV